MVNILYTFLEEQRDNIPNLEINFEKESLDKPIDSIENISLNELKQINIKLSKDLDDLKNKYNNNVSIFNNYKNTHNKHIFYLTDEIEKLKETIVEKDNLIDKYKKDIESKTTNTVNHINVDINSIEDQTQFLKFYKELTSSNNLPTNYNYNINTENNSGNIRKV